MISEIPYLIYQVVKIFKQASEQLLFFFFFFLVGAGIMMMMMMMDDKDKRNNLNLRSSSIHPSILRNK